MVINKVHCPFAFSHAYQTIGIFTSRIIELSDASIHHIEFHSKIQCQSIFSSISNTAPKYITISVVILNHGEVCTSIGIIVIHVRHVESLAIVITEAIVLHDIHHPLGISTEHLTHFFLTMRQITSCPIIRFTIITIFLSTSSFSPTILIRIPFHLIVLGDITTIYLEISIFTKILFVERAPPIFTFYMIHNHIGNHLSAAIMKLFYQILQLSTLSPITVLIAILLRMIAYSTRRQCRWWQPNKVEVRGNLFRFLLQIPPARTSIVFILIRIPIESLQHHIRACRWYR